MRGKRNAALVGLLALLCTAYGLAQANTDTGLRLRMEPALRIRMSDGSPGVYQDQVLETGAQGLNYQGETAYGSYNPTGLPRGWSAEYRLTQQRSSDSANNASAQGSQALLLSSYLDTPNYGLLSFNVNTSSAHSANLMSSNPANTTSSALQTWRIDQRSLPLTALWSANHSAGFLYTPLPSLSRGNSRTTLTSHPIEGAAGEWQRGTDMSLNASTGKLGFFTGRDSQGFMSERGSLDTVGAQVKLSGKVIGEESPHAAIAVQGLQTQSQQALWGSYVWQGFVPWAAVQGQQESGPIAQRTAGLRLQTNVLQTSSASPAEAAKAAKGASIDASWRSERLQHTGGYFYFQPNLRWGLANLASDIQGLSWRAEYTSRVWSTGLGTEFSHPISTPWIHNNFVNGFARYRMDSKNTLAATGAIRSGTAAGQSNQLTWDHQSDWGTSQWRTDWLRGTDIQAKRIGIDQRWPSGTTRSLSTALAYNTTTLMGTQTNQIEWGILGTTTWSKARLDANLRGTLGHNNLGERSDNLNVNIDFSWPLAASWSLVGQLNVAQGKASSPLAITAASTQIGNNPATSSNLNQTIVIALRYQDRAGSSSAPLGGSLGAGSGVIEGVVYYDLDRNKQRGTGEAGVEGVTIVLNKRFQTRTDAQGRFKFPAVAAGEHSLELIPDNVPLPWYAARSGSVPVRVQVRDTSAVDFSLQRDP